MDKLIEYMNIHLISLNQDMDKDLNVESKINIQGQIMAIEHLLSVADDILMSSNFDDIHYSGGIH
jgi:hypothetical protein